MNIGFDAKRAFFNATGLGNYSRDVIRSLSSHPEGSIRLHLFTPSIPGAGPGKDLLENPFCVIHSPSHPFRSWWRTFQIAGECGRVGIDLYHGLSHELPRGIHKTRVKSIVTIHDLIYRHYPQQYKTIDRLFYDSKCKYACRVADVIFADSQATKNDIVEMFAIEESRIVVMPLACDPTFYTSVPILERKWAREKYGIPSEYMLYVGSIIERKRLLSVIEAMRRLNTHDAIPLVVIGKGSGYKVRVMDAVRQYNLQDRVIFPGTVDWEDLPSLYQDARLFIYPSVREGFGLPNVEALFSRVPVITSCFSSLPESAGPSSCQVDPDDYDALADAIRRVLSDRTLREEMVEHGWTYAQHFRSENVTPKIIDHYRKIISNGR